MADLVRTLIALVIPAMNFLLLFTVGLDLTENDFARVRRQPALIASGLVAPLVLLPPIAVGLIWLLQPGPAVAASLLLIAACPIGGISNAFTYLARASTALSVTLTGLSCVAASVTIPLVGKAFEISLRQPFALSAPLSTLIGQLVVVLGLPVALGMLDTPITSPASPKHSARPCVRWPSSAPPSSSSSSLSMHPSHSWVG